MNKRLPLLLSLIGAILLAVSLAYWILQLYQPPQRPLAAVPHAALPEPAVDAAASLFGGQIAVATNYQLTGIVAAGRDSAAIIVADNAPPKALRLGRELVPGITLAEVHPRYVMLSENGALKRLDLAVDAKAAAPMGPNGVLSGVPGAPGAAAGQPGAMASPVPVAAQPVPASAAPEPPMAPGAVNQPAQQGQQGGFNRPGDVGTHDNPPPANPNSIVTPSSQTQMPPPQPGAGTQ